MADIKKHADKIANMTAMVLAISLIGGKDQSEKEAGSMMEAAVKVASTVIAKDLTDLRDELRREILDEIHSTNSKLAGITTAPAA